MADDTFRTTLPQSADTLEDARALALHYQSVAADQGSKIMRLRIALKIIREFGGFGQGFHGGVMLTMTKWMDDGMDGPVPWPESVFFDTWAAAHGMSNVGGFVGFRLTLKLEPVKPDADCPRCRGGGCERCRNTGRRMVEMPLSDANDLDAVVHELCIEDSDVTPAEAVRALKSKLEEATLARGRLRLWLEFISLNCASHEAKEFAGEALIGRHAPEGFA